MKVRSRTFARTTDGSWGLGDNTPKVLLLLLSPSIYTQKNGNNVDRKMKTRRQINEKVDTINKKRELLVYAAERRSASN